jgi:hypothetical protein
MMIYDPQLALQAIDQNAPLILLCLAGALGFSFVYFIIGIRMAIRQKVYVEPFLGASLFFWHDLSFSMHYDTWMNVYNGHWWLMMWTVGLLGTVALEAFLIYQFIKYGRKEIFPEMSQGQFTAMTLAAVAAIGVLWFFVKASLNDPLYFITFAVTAFWSTPFHTAIMLRRRSSAGQSVWMNISVMILFSCVSAAFMIAVPAFRSPLYLAVYAVFVCWPLFNIWMIRRMPSAPAYQEPVPINFGNQGRGMTGHLAAAE